MRHPSHTHRSSPRRPASKPPTGSSSREPCGGPRPSGASFPSGTPPVDGTPSTSPSAGTWKRSSSAARARSTCRSGRAGRTTSCRCPLRPSRPCP